MRDPPGGIGKHDGKEEPGHGRHPGPVSNEKTPTPESTRCAPEDGGPRFVQTPSHIYPINPRSGSLFRAEPFSGGAASFSQQIPKVICERSCRKAKTLTVKITRKEEKKRGKTKKNRKKTGKCAFFGKNNVKNVKNPGPGRKNRTRGRKNRRRVDGGGRVIETASPRRPSPRSAVSAAGRMAADGAMLFASGETRGRVRTSRTSHDTRRRCVPTPR